MHIISPYSYVTIYFSSQLLLNILVTCNISLLETISFPGQNIKMCSEAQLKNQNLKKKTVLIHSQVQNTLGKFLGTSNKEKMKSLK